MLRQKSPVKAGANGPSAMITNTYPVVYASPRRDSFIAVVTAASGRPGWSHVIGEPVTPNWLPIVLVWGTNTVVATYDSTMIIGPTGARVWEGARRPGSPICIANDLLYYMSATRFLQAVDSSGRPILMDFAFPIGTDRDDRLSLFWARKNDFVAVSTFVQTTETDAPISPSVTCLRNDYGITYGSWISRCPGKSSLAPLFVPETGSLAIVTDVVIRYDVQSERELSRFVLPVTGAIDWSVDDKERYVVSGYTGVLKTLVEFGSQGVELWRWTDSEHSDMWLRSQPPIRSTDDRVYMLTTERVLAIDHGKLSWEYRFIEEPSNSASAAEVALANSAWAGARGDAPRYASALADGSILVVGGKMLSRLDSGGHLMMSTVLGDTIVSPPVVDSAGLIYVATMTGLQQIQ